ncbi:MAG TPA: beta-ketoacyl synthase N-terminal-like domain-containing protein, partial [Nevskiaceae bacterium]|nr:beta-ketoacyl synthase N-terminal-like domain-containing protein [Nevskiaceae bacterium]
MTRDSFKVFTLHPLHASQMGLAQASTHSSDATWLDLEFCADAEAAEDALGRLVNQGAHGLGLRVTPERLELARRLQAFAPRAIASWIVAGPAVQRAALLGALPQLGDGKLLIEITDATELDGLAHQPDGWVVRGHEAGGWVGADTSFILLQKVMAAAPQAPVYALGGIGTHSAAACRAAGAAGVVLTDSLLLLRESHLPFALAASLARLDGSETRLLAERDGCGCRVYAPPGSSALREMETRLQAPPTEHPQGANPDDATRATLFAACGWTATPSLLPVGQEIGFAARYRTRYGSLGRLVQAVRRAAIHHVEAAARLQHLAPGAPLARAHGTRFPLAQGPMTRVSDSAAFAAAVAQAGALPFLAMALMRGPQVAAMLKATREACQTMAGELPWGVGMLGFVPHALRQEQCEAIWACKPPYALIAGGRPDQAAEFEKHGISTYIHAPAPALLKLYYEQGARRFVFEGRECGGHIGPIASFVLWEEAIDTLLDVVKRGHEDEVHVLFAGGVHDALSGAMLATMTAPLAARGFKVGALMGTAYLFTDEIVSSGAVVPGFQQEALACRRTASLETGPGHTTRCADTRFAHEFHATRTRLLGEGTDPNALRDALEDLNLGRLRIAAKGLTRDAEGQLVTVDEPHQHHDGMYMIGQAATLAHHTQPIAALHESVTVDALQRLRDCDAQVAPEPPRACPAHVAIVGIGTLLPGADHVDAYWNNILQQVSAIREVPQTRWDWQLYYDADRHAKDRVYSRWGGFLDEVPFDPLAYGIPPKSMKRIDPLQLLTLEVVRRGLEDAGWSMARDADNDFDRDNTSIILGTSGGLGDLGTQYAVRAEIPRFIDNPSPEVWRRLPEWSEESFAGSLLNVAAGRVANRMDLGGINMTCDAACASSLAAISIAVNELTSGRSNVAIAGGVDTVQTPFGYLCFSTTQALSPRGKPEAFDQNADGIVISEGLAIVVLKRLADAERDGDRIYAVIEALAGSSDGKALGMTAPRPFGQKRALYRAYQRAGFSPTTLSMIEAHGTGTAVGDKAEAQTITEALGEYHAAPRSVAVGSVKALLGHTKAAAGVVGLTKVALSLYHRTLPGHAAAQHPIEVLADPQSPACLLRQPLPWLADPRHPRRGASSAFGFGGTNFHAVLEEYRGPTQGVAGGARWPWELIILSAADGASLAAECKQLATALRQQPDFTLRDLAATLAAQRPRALRVALVAHDFASLADDLDALHAHFAAQQPLPAAARGGQPGTLIAADSVAFLFPGQGAQYVGMGREVALYCEELRAALELADRQLLPRFPQRLSQRILPPTAFVPAEQDAQKAALTDTRVAQPAIGAVSLGYLWLARRLALHAGATAGHSYGEYAALLAAGVLGAEDFLELSAVRGQAMAMAATAENVDHGTMAAINAPRHVVEALIKEYTELRVANHNAPEQSVISGDVADIEAVLERCRAQGIRASRLPVSAAFHTPRMNGARAPLTAAIHAAHFNTPRATVYSNTLGAAYPSDVDAIRAQLDEHLLSSVEFVQEIGAMYDAGARVFIEVGPKNICTGLAQRILAGHDDVHCVALDGNGGGLRGLLLGLAELWSAGVALDLGQLFDGRDAHTLDLRQLPQKDTAKLPRHLWMVSGGCARPIGDPVIRTGELPALTRRDVDALRAQAAAEAATPPPAPMGTAVARFTAPVTDASQATQGTTSAAAPLPPPPANGPLATEAIVAYQQTMRQFLALQEHVLQQFLGGNAAATQSGLPAQPFAAANSLAASAPSPLAVPAVVPSVQLPPASPAAEEFITGVHAETPKASSSPAPVPVNIARTLLDIVAERTGYPPEMLDQNADLEADLGIDSIKRVEILGALQKALPTATGVAMQAAMERFTKARSLAAIVTGIEQLGPVQAPVPTPAAVPVASPVAAATDVTALLTGIVADRTGYPPEMLDQNADLEADLGIDSIKRVEILGALQKALPTATGVAMQAAMERFTKARSLAAIVAEL